MTALLNEGIRAVRELPSERQDAAGEILLTLARQSRRDICLDEDQLAEVALAVCEADAGDFATDEEMREIWQPSR